MFCLAQNISCSSTGREPCMCPMQSLRAVGPQRWGPFRPELGCHGPPKYRRPCALKAWAPGTIVPNWAPCVRRVCVELGREQATNNSLTWYQTFGGTRNIMKCAWLPRSAWYTYLITKGPWTLLRHWGLLESSPLPSTYASYAHRRRISLHIWRYIFIL